MSDAPLVMSVGNDILGQSAGHEVIFRTRGVVAPHVHVHHEGMTLHNVVKLVPALKLEAGGIVVHTVDLNALVDPVPTVLHNVARIAADLLHVVNGLSVELGGVGVDTEDGTQLLTFLHQGLHIVRAAHADADVVILGMVGVVTLAGVALQEHKLAQAVGVGGHPLHVVQSNKEWVGSHRAKVHGDAEIHRVGHIGATGRDVEDGLPECNGAVLPIHSAITILVPGNDYLGVRGLQGGPDLLLRSEFSRLVAPGLIPGNVVIVVPQGATQTNGGGSVAVLGLKLSADGIVRTSGRAANSICRIAGQAGGQLIVGDEGRKEVLLILAGGGGQIARGRVLDIAAANGVGRQLSSLHLRLILGGSDGHQAVIGDGNIVHRVGQTVGALAAVSAPAYSTLVM